MRVLVVEDERLLADSIVEGLRRLSTAVDVCYDGGEALERVGVHDYNAVRVVMMTLRRKLGTPQVIETVPGAGYRFTS
ncbi:winged helix-turn-helix domain-containing protein [Umezawaea endophytica]|uniref:winged helix-turn-helix domain-containing protein n=1 Tax=Umezawaea endophytica TaxID=1654476 RepID=UPI003556A175